MVKSDHLDKYKKLFEQEMSENDPLQQVILKGHLIIEVALDNIISLIFFYAEHVFKARLGFIQKIAIARAYCLRKDANTIWDVLLAINEVRNEVAHNLAGEKRVIKINKLRGLWLAEVTNEMRAHLEETVGRPEDMTNESVVFFACSLCAGFLGTYEDDIRALRKIIDVTDYILNPDIERVLPKTPEEARAKKIRR